MVNRIAVIFDFDETLAPDSTSSFLEGLGVDVEDFWANKVTPMYKEQGWDPIPAYLYKIIELSKMGDERSRITQEKLAAFGKEITFFNGAHTIFKKLRAVVREVNPKVEVEFFLLSSGLRDILVSTRIAKYFKDIWACDFHYNEKGEIEDTCINMNDEIVDLIPKIQSRIIAKCKKEYPTNAWLLVAVDSLSVTEKRFWDQVCLGIGKIEQTTFKSIYLMGISGDGGKVITRIS